MPRYKISNRITKEVGKVEAPFAQDACEILGWMIGNCYIELLREGPYTYPASHSLSQYDPTIREYIACAMDGHIVFGATAAECEARLREANRAYIEHCQKCRDEQDWELRQQSRRMQDGV